LAREIGAANPGLRQDDEIRQEISDKEDNRQEFENLRMQETPTSLICHFRQSTPYRLAVLLASVLLVGELLGYAII
jgi:hypothetical protein